MEISCAFATSSDTPVHAELAEALGYKRAWLYDSPAVYPDVWMVLSRCAERTSRIGLGAVGSGFSGRLALGTRPIPWRRVAEYVRCLKALLAGETAEWDGSVLRMLHLPGFGADRPIEVPILIGADGPKGLAVAAELGDGVFSAALPQPDAAGITDWRGPLSFGTGVGGGGGP